ncbi:MAG TPA: NUDIX hydrolase [Candidatus Acidoferrales bacterium]|nr:NUDIX hydrolase [Candidatus Acidoferrales bacterium]
MPKKRKPVKVTASKLVFKGKVFGVRRDRVIEPGGVRALREIVVHGGSVVVLPILPDGRILLIRQYRYAAGESLWEIVAGHKEPDEGFLEGAHRELQEETGYTARHMTELLDFFPSPGLLTERMVVFLAQGLSGGAARMEQDERITKRAFTLGEIDRLLQARKIRDAKTIAAVLFYARFSLLRKPRPARGRPPVRN